MSERLAKPQPADLFADPAAVGGASHGATGHAPTDRALEALAAAVAEPVPVAASASRRGSEKRQRGHFVPVRCTEAERVAIIAAADKAGLSVGAYLRAQALGTPGVRAARRPPIEREALAQLLGQIGKLGSNVNQLAHMANAAGAQLTRRELNQIGDEVRVMRAAVLKALGRGD